jgi:hypothetical protein
VHTGKRRAVGGVDGHSDDSYSFGVTEDGAQNFNCRGAAHTSAVGMIMAAVQAGFADQSHRTRWFSRYYGITPGRYQRRALIGGWAEELLNQPPGG